jgi:hypothetical protein
MANNWTSEKVYLELFEGFTIDCADSLSPLISFPYRRQFEYIIEQSSDHGV